MFEPSDTADPMKLFYAPNSIAVAAALALQETGLPHKRVRVDFANAEQTKPDYLAINPKGRVPALATEGTILTETGAILEYIAAKSGALLPSDPMETVKMRTVMYYLATTMHVNHAHKMRGHRWADLPESHADMTAKVPQTMTSGATYVEAECLAGPFILGDALTIGDCYLFAVCRWLDGDGVDVSQFPRVSAFLDAMSARPAVKALDEAGVLG